GAGLGDALGDVVVRLRDEVGPAVQGEDRAVGRVERDQPGPQTGRPVLGDLRDRVDRGVLQRLVDGGEDPVADVVELVVGDGGTVDQLTAHQVEQVTGG